MPGKMGHNSLLCYYEPLDRLKESISIFGAVRIYRLRASPSDTRRGVVSLVAHMGSLYLNLPYLIPRAAPFPA
jgi:hypothetical protein